MHCTRRRGLPASVGRLGYNVLLTLRRRQMHPFYVTLAASAYLLSLGCYLYFLTMGKETSGGLVAHYFALLDRSRALHTVPYHDLYGALSLFGWLLALTYLILELFHRQRSVGAYVVPFVLVFFLAASVAPPDRLSPPPAHGTTFALHVTLSILAYAAFALSFVLSIIFLSQERLLRSRKLDSVVWRLPSLELLERMSQSSVLIGLISIVGGTIMGFLWVDR